MDGIYVEIVKERGMSRDLSFVIYEVSYIIGGAPFLFCADKIIFRSAI